MKTYNIDSFKRLANVVNEENCERLAIDIGKALIFYAHAISKWRKQNPGLSSEMYNSNIAEFEFDWIDDGKHEIHKPQIIAKETGEIL